MTGSEDDRSTRDEITILERWARRFDGFGYSPSTGFKYEEALQTFFRTGSWPTSRLDQLATFCLLEAFMWSSGKHGPKNSRYWFAFRDLFLLVYDYEIPETWRDADHYAEWEYFWAPHAQKCAEKIRQIHRSTVYEDAPPGMEPPLR